MKFLKKISLIFAGLALGFAVSCKEKNNTSIVKKQEISFTKEGELQFYNKDSTLITTLAIEIADTDYEIETGLMYRTAMKDNQGMLFIFKEEQPRYFYMKNTQIPLDIIYISAEKHIVNFAKNAVPLDETSLPSNAPAQYVLEVNAGLTNKWRLAIGDSVSFSSKSQ